MNSSRPYLLRAIYEWLVDNTLTPYIMVDAMIPHVEVPERFVEDGKIVLNIEPQAVGNLRLGNDAVEFDARFSGIGHHIFIPIQAIKAVYAFENGRGMVFSEEDDDDQHNPPPCGTKPPAKKGRPNLKVVK
jgi:stringent starvation protein B